MQLMEDFSLFVQKVQVMSFSVIKSDCKIAPVIFFVEIDDSVDRRQNVELLAQS